MDKILVKMSILVLFMNGSNFIRVVFRNESDRTIYFLNNTQYFDITPMRHYGGFSSGPGTGLSLCISSDKVQNLDRRVLSRSGRTISLLSFDSLSRHRETYKKIKKSMPVVNVKRVLNKFMLKNSVFDSVLPNDSSFFDIRVDDSMFLKKNFTCNDTKDTLKLDSLLLEGCINFFYSFNREKKKRRNGWDDSYKPNLYNGYRRIEIRSEKIKFPLH